MKLIVTGGAGFVGSHLVEKLVAKGHHPIIVDNISSGNFDYIQEFVNDNKATFSKIDIRNQESVDGLPSVPALIHLAAIPSVVESIRNPSYVNDVNVNGTLNLLEFCRKRNVKRFIFVSSAAIYGGYESKIAESSPTVPNTVYGATKLTGEQYCRIYSELFGIHSVILRPFNIYGPRQKDSYAGVISKFIQRIASSKRPIIYGDGRQTRDFIHVTDVADALVLALEYAKKSSFDYFNLATGKSVTINNLANMFLELAGKERLEPIYKDAIPGVITHSSANIHKISTKLRFRPQVALKKGLNELLKHSV